MALTFDTPAEVGLDVTAGVIDERNFASNEAVARAARDAIWEQTEDIINMRVGLTRRFERFEALDRNKPMEKLYMGRTQINIPRAMKVVETRTDRISDGLFPLDSYYTMQPLNQFADQRAEPNKRVIDYFVEHSGLRGEIKLFVRDLLKNGTGIMKSPWTVKSNPVYRRAATLGDNSIGLLPTGVPSTYTQRRDIVQYEGPRPTVTDLLRWFCSPLTAKNIDECELIFEDIDVDRNHLHKMASLPPTKGYDMGKVKRLISLLQSDQSDSKSNDQIHQSRMRRLEKIGVYPEAYKLKSGIVNLLEYWCLFPLYEHVKTPEGRNAKEWIPCKMVVGLASDGEPVPLQIKQNPYYEQRPPYHACRLRKRHDSFYGGGLLELVEFLNYVLNAFFGQAIDSANFTLNQLAVVDVMKLLIRPKDIRFAPLGVVPVRGEPGKAIQFISPPDMTQVAIQLATICAGMIEDEMATTPTMQGRVGGHVAGATHAAILNQASQIFDSSVVEQVEYDVLTPMLRFWFQEASQFMSERMWRQINPGVDFQRDTIERVIGDYDLNWSVGQTSRKMAQVEQELMQTQIAKAQLELILMQLTGQMAGSSPSPGRGTPSNGGGGAGIMGGDMSSLAALGLGG